jgi:hypothetical protein
MSSLSEFNDTFFNNRALSWCTANNSFGTAQRILELIWWSKSCISGGKDGSVVPNQAWCKRSRFLSNSTDGWLPLCIVLVNSAIRKGHIQKMTIVQSLFFHDFLLVFLIDILEDLPTADSNSKVE